MNLQKPKDLNEKRRAIRPLLSPSDPADALASYYALWHDPRRTQLTLHHDAGGRADGFVAVCQTGADLFRPLVTLRAPNAQAVGELLGNSLTPNRPYQLIVPATLASALRQHMELAQTSLLHIYRLDPARFQPIINVLVQRVATPSGAPRFQIESQGQPVALSGVNWRSPNFGEIFVHVDPRGRGRAWGQSVVSACTAALLAEGRRPLYLVEPDNEVSIRLAEGLGYVDTGQRQFLGQGQLHE